ncbi:MAG: hypothetical protein IKL65_03440 [Bacilli bacterium]|nr:hypothetical protein [Bacilli bacterium]
MYVEDKLDIYNDSAIILDKKAPKKIISWITILIVLSIIFVIFSFVPFNVYKPLVGYIDIKGNDSYIVLSLNNSDFPINKDNKLYIKNKQYNFKIVKVQEDKLVIKINLDNNLKVENNIITVNILKNRTTLFKIIKNKIKKGFGV